MNGVGGKLQRRSQNEILNVNLLLTPLYMLCIYIHTYINGINTPRNTKNLKISFTHSLTHSFLLHIDFERKWKFCVFIFKNTHIWVCVCVCIGITRALFSFIYRQNYVYAKIFFGFFLCVRCASPAIDLFCVIMLSVLLCLHFEKAHSN